MNIIYVANSYAGLLIINVSDPAHPAEAGFYDTPGWASGVTVAGNSTYVADGGGGLVILGYLPYQIRLPLVLHTQQ